MRFIGRRCLLKPLYVSNQWQIQLLWDKRAVTEKNTGKTTFLPDIGSISKFLIPLKIISILNLAHHVSA